MQQLKLTIAKEIELWHQENKSTRLWQHDASLWTNANENQWLGWLNLTELECALAEITEFVAATNNITDLVLLGMGGSSLSAQLFNHTFKHNTNLRLTILDSTHPQQISNLENKINLATTLFILASKSGTTLEVHLFKEYFYKRLQEVLGLADVGKHFICITDPDTPLAMIAQYDSFRAIFYGIPTIGGRYSALSNFGMLPLGFLNVNLKEFFVPVHTMARTCMSSDSDNSAITLGITLGVAAKLGKDKITLVISPAIAAFGAWLEQLLAESTGKQGTGVIPITLEPLAKPNFYNNDRIFIYIRLDSKFDPIQDHHILQLQNAGFMVIKLNIPNPMHLGAELFRWQITTTVIAQILKVNPFDQPDVEESKILTAHLTNQYIKTKKLPILQKIHHDADLTLFTDPHNYQILKQNLQSPPHLGSYLQAHLQRAKTNDYIALSAFLPDQYFQELQKIRALLRNQTNLATTLGMGPRFLHSTAQNYKSGKNIGLFIQITARLAPEDDLVIPERNYTFGTLLAIQAQADFTILAQRHRRILRVHLNGEISTGLKKLQNIVSNNLYSSSLKL